MVKLNIRKSFSIIFFSFFNILWVSNGANTFEELNMPKVLI